MGDLRGKKTHPNPELQKADLETFFHNFIHAGKLGEALKGLKK
ncbi:hypothetical protein [Moorena producens]